MFPESSAASVESRTPQILVVGGGKGGVGKTCFAVNVSVEIASKGGAWYKRPPSWRIATR